MEITLVLVGEVIDVKKIVEALALSQVKVISIRSIIRLWFPSNGNNVRF